MSETRIDYLHDPLTGGIVYDHEGRPLLTKAIDSQHPIPTNSVRAELTPASLEQMRLVVREELAHIPQAAALKLLSRYDTVLNTCIESDYSLEELRMVYQRLHIQLEALASSAKEAPHE